MLQPGLYASGSGSTITGSQVTVVTTAAQSIAVDAANGGNIALTDSLIQTQGSQSTGVITLNNATASLVNTSVQTTGNAAAGVEANNNSLVTLQGGTVTTGGVASAGLFNIGAGANLTANSTAVLTTGNNSTGALNQAGGLMTLENVSITTSGANADGVEIGSQGVIGNGSTSDTTVISNSRVTTLGNAAAGLMASDNATLIASNVTIRTNGVGSYGVASLFGAQTSVQGGSINTTGDNGFGLMAVGMPATVGDAGTQAPTLNVGNVTVTTSGAGAPTAYLAGGANLTVTDSTLSASGAGSNALDAYGFDTSAPAIANVTGSTLTSALADGVHATNVTLNATLTNSTVTAAANAMAATSNGTLNLVANNTTLTGAAQTDSTSTLNAALLDGSVWNVTGASTLSALTLDNATVRYLSATQINAGAVVLGADGGTFDTNGFDAGLDAPISGTGALTKTGDGTLTLTGANSYTGATTVSAGTLQAGSANAFSASSAFTVSSGAILDLNDLSQTVAALSNSGTVHFGSSAGTTLTVTGDYVGNGGVIAMNTVLGDSSSLTDLLHVQGSTSGNSGLQINNAGGLGAQTTGDGIKLIQVDGASGGTFTQTAQIEAGAYEYTLYKGGVGADASNGNWYLRSTLQNPAVDNTDDAQSSPGIDLAAPAVAATAESAIAYRPAAIGYVMTPQLDADYGFAMLGTLHRRVGDVPGAVRPDNANTDGIWARVDAQSESVAAINRFSADARSAFMQFGKDWTIAAPSTGGSTHAGVTLTFGSASADFSDGMRSLAGLTTSTGSVGTDMQALGGYWTRYLATGGYSDSVLQLAHYRNRYNDNQGNTPGQNGYGLSASEELGMPFQIASLPLAIEPQVQLAYQYLHLGAFNDTVSDISSTSSNALRGRIGFRVFHTAMENAGHTGTATPYLAVNLEHDFLAPGQTSVGGTTFDAAQARTWIDAAIGITATFGKRGELYAAADYARNLGGQHSRGVSGNLGYRYSW